MDRRNFLKSAGATLAGAAAATYPLSRSVINAAETPPVAPNIPAQDNYYARSVITEYGKPNRNDDIFCYDMEGMEPGEYSKKLVNLMKEVMRRNEGFAHAQPMIAVDKDSVTLQNSWSYPPQRERLKDLYMSPEAMEDIRKWGCDEIDETTRKEILSGHSDVKLFNSINICVSDQLEPDEIVLLPQTAIDWQLKYARDARWDVVQRANKILLEGFEKKMTAKGW